ncbi:hypothetical protein C0966_17580 (plasmid) [Bacillus methanolicus]|uniref:hypothetical protein n=1 Tax=Bacillus methanolicus TaxID=1471 RepID=UPI00238036BE|nr:hypothetical protein [Bacillus methanolicus]MDE3841075.1 hypothetical protein [Bacillus methanolicus]
MFQTIFKRSSILRLSKKNQQLHDLVIGETLSPTKTHLVLSHTAQIQKLKDTISECYLKKHRDFVKELDAMDTDELIELACNILCGALHMIRMLGWSNKNSSKNHQLRDWLSSEIADSTHNLPSAIQSRNDFHLKQYIAEFLCLVDALQQNFRLLVETLKDNTKARNLEIFLHESSKYIRENI